MAMQMTTSLIWSRDSGDLLGERLCILLRLLNSEPDSAIVTTASAVSQAELEVRKHRFLGFAGKQPDWLQGKALYNPLFRNEEEVRKLRERLRMMVNAWIDTGLGKQGVEAPENRSLGPIELKHNLRLYALVADGNAHEQSGYFEETAEGLFMSMTSPNFKAMLQLSVGDASEGKAQSVTFRVEKSIYGEPQSMPNQVFGTVFLLLSSEDRFHIAKCRGTKCGHYFYRKRTSRAKLGIFCGSECRNKKTAGDRTREMRAKKTGELVKLAADAMAKLEVVVNAPTKALKIGIVEAVNKRKGSKTITRRWVTQHWKEIERAAFVA